MLRLCWLYWSFTRRIRVAIVVQSLLTTMSTLVTLVARKTIFKRMWVAANVWWAALRTILYVSVMFIETNLLLRSLRWFRSIITVWIVFKRFIELSPALFSGCALAGWVTTMQSIVLHWRIRFLSNFSF